MEANSVNFEAGGYYAKPLHLSYADMDEFALASWKANYIVKRCSEHEAFFSDYMKDTPAARNAVIATLGKPDTLLWEVHSKAAKSADHLDLAGILRLSEVVPGCSAKAHYFFFDGHLRDKTELLQSWKDWAFTVAGLHRVTIEVPGFAKALASHARRHLGFIDEGCMRQAIKWRGDWHDVHILGCLA